MDQLHLMTVFVEVAELQGFAPAARKLHMSPPAVTRAVAALEQRVGVKLLNRTTRCVKVTEAGLRYLQDARRILYAVEQANEAALGVHSEPKGLLRVTAPVLFGQQQVLPKVVEYLNTYPDVQVETVFLDRVVGLLEEGIDVGVRIGHLPDSSLQARPVGGVSMVLVASPDYLAKQGRPQHPKALRNHVLIAASAGDFNYDWQFAQDASVFSIRICPRLSVNTNQAAINAAKAGLGIARVLSYQVREDLVQGSLDVLLVDFQLPPLPVHIVHREGTNASSKVRSFIDLLAPGLRKSLLIN